MVRLPRFLGEQLFVPAVFFVIARSFAKLEVEDHNTLHLDILAACALNICDTRRSLERDRAGPMLGDEPGCEAEADLGPNVSKSGFPKIGVPLLGDPDDEDDSIGGVY